MRLPSFGSAIRPRPAQRSGAAGPLLALAALLLVAVAPVALAADLPKLPANPAPGAPGAPNVPVAPPQSGLFDTGLVMSLSVAGLGVGAVLGLLWYLGVGGLRQIDSKNVLEHPLRQALLQTVQQEPGAHLRELAARHKTAVTNTQWHLRKLEMANLVKTQKVQGKRVYYPVQGGVASRDRAIQNAALRNPNAEGVRAYIAAKPGAEIGDIADALHLNPGTVRWHLRRLEEAGLLRLILDGERTMYYAMTANRPERPPRPLAIVRQRDDGRDEAEAAMPSDAAPADPAPAEPQIQPTEG